VSEQQDRDRKDPTVDLDLSEDEAGSVKGGRAPVEGGGDSGSTGFSLSSVSWKMRRRGKKKQSGSSAGGRPV
jgi:hypothetical protein